MEISDHHRDEHILSFEERDWSMNTPGLETHHCKLFTEFLQCFRDNYVWSEAYEVIPWSTSQTVGHCPGQSGETTQLYAQRLKS